MNGLTIGVDIGGTFTDVVVSDGERVWRAKSPTTPDDLGVGVVRGCRLAAERAGAPLEELLPRVERFGLGTTAVTNTIASRTGRRVGLVTTRDFEDLVPVARGIRASRDGWLMPPDGLIDPEWIVGVDERTDRHGKILREVRPEAAAQAARRLVAQHGVEAVTVSFLWSWLNPTNEELAVEAIAAALPDIPVCSGSGLLPVIREYERTTFALLNAYTSGSLTGVDALAERLASLGLRRAPLLVHSGGGSITLAEGRRVPVTLAESGPAAGVVASVALTGTLGIDDAVTCDTGGTSFDMSIIENGRTGRRNRGELMGVWTALPMVDIESVGSGGGSIGWVDPLGILRVGPRSAGSVPGPACYGRGGTEVTVTDALLVLGYLDPARFVGGEMSLDVDAAVRACERLGTRIGADAARTAWGVLAIAKADMVSALRSRFAARGLDPRGFTMVSVGGCGGLLAADIAASIHIPRILFPEFASVFSAFGAASADIRRERSRSVGVVLPSETGMLERLSGELAADVRADLDADGVPRADQVVGFQADLRFHRQKWELSIDWTEGFDLDAQRRALTRFTDEYVRHYGSGALLTGAPVEVVSVRAVGEGRAVKAGLARRAAGPDADAPVTGTRRVDLGGVLGRVDVPVVAREDLRPGHRLTGPVVVDSVDTTLWLPPGSRATVDRYGTVDLRTEASR